MTLSKNDLYTSNKVFHGTTGVYSEISYHNIEKINIDKSKKRRDFGKGYYTTFDYEQAERWANRLSENKEKEENQFDYENTQKEYNLPLKEPVQSSKIAPLVIEYPFNYRKDSDLNVKIFEQPDDQWLKFIFDHRKFNPADDRDCKHNYDMVYGYAADGQLKKIKKKFEKDFANLTPDDKNEIFAVFYARKKKSYTQLSLNKKKALKEVLKNGQVHCV